MVLSSAKEASDEIAKGVNGSFKVRERLWREIVSVALASAQMALFTKPKDANSFAVKRALHARAGELFQIVGDSDLSRSVKTLSGIDANTVSLAGVKLYD